MSRGAFVGRLPSLDVLAGRLDRARARRVGELLAARRGAVAMAGAALRTLRAEGADPGARAAARATVDRVARELLGALRRTPRFDEDPAGALARHVDGALRSTRPELLDRDVVPRAIKQLTMRLLDRVNRSLGSYERWAEALMAALAPRSGDGAAHVHDLAAGNGGFFRHLAAHAAPGRPLRLTSSDLDPALVAAGETLARRDRLDVRFAVVDALDLRGVEGVDLFVCTQAVHHLSPGQVVELFAQAIAAAPLGLLVVDLARGVIGALSAALVLPLLAPFPPLVLDGVQSVRRSYAPAELTLLARIAGARHVDARPLRPAHHLVHARA